MKPRIISISILIFVLISLVSCAPITRPVQSTHPDFESIQESETLGQTFTANYNGLQDVTLYLKTKNPGYSTVILSIKENIEDEAFLATDHRNLNEFSNEGYYRFTFDPFNDSNQQDYYLQLEITGPGELLVGTGIPDSYLDGALYKNSLPIEAQLSLLLGYDLLSLIWGIILEFLYWLLLLIVVLILFVLPGWIFLSLYWNGWSDLFWAEKLGLGISLSLALYPLLILWTNVFHIQMGILYALLPVIIALLLLIWHKRGSLTSLKFPNLNVKKMINWPNVVLIVFLILLFGVRFWVIRGLEIPLWGDGYQHTLITQLIVDNKGLFDLWRPYAELHTFTYHFGFHSLSAVFSWITRVPVNQGVLWTGQIINGLAVLTLFPLAMRMRRSVWAGIITVLCAGFLFTMPMYFVNWSRFTQLAGLAILATYASFAWEYLSTDPTNKKYLVICSVAMAGLALTHYRVLIFGLIFLITFLLFYFRSLGFRNLILRLFWMGMLSLLLFTPWFINIFSGKLLDIFGYQISTPSSALVSSQASSVGIGNIFNYLPAIVWGAAPLLLGWALWRRNKGIAIISVWWLLIFLAANPQWFNLPGVGTLTTFAVLISSFFPISIIIGESAAWLINELQEILNQKAHEDAWAIPIKKLLIPAISITLIAVCVWAANTRKNDLNEFQHSLTTRPDLRASDWIDTNLTKNDKFLVNSFFAYGDSLIVGADGGWWLPLLTNRETTLPPLNYGAEQGLFPDYIHWTNELTKNIEDLGIDHPDVKNMLIDRGITHVYIGQRQGLVGTDHPLLEVDQLIASPNYTPLYHQDRVWIFSFNPN